MKVVVLSWHSGDTAEITTGGYRRFYEIAKRSPLELIIIDRYPSLYSSLKSSKIKVVEYGRIFNLKLLSFLPSSLYALLDRLLTVFLILDKVAKNRKDVSAIYVPFSEHVELTLPAVISKFLFKVPLVFCNLNVNIYFLERPLNAFLHRFANKVITISKALQKDLIKSGIKTGYINGVGFDFSKTSAKKFAKKYDAIFIGRHTKEKGFFDLLEIWNILVKKFKKRFMLVTIGNIPGFYYQQIKRKIKNYKLKQYVNMLGEVSESEKIKYLAQSKILVFPSRQEGWGIAPMEALSLGLPVIAYNLDVYKESIGDTLAFRKVKLGGIDDFAKEIIKVSQNLDKFSKVARLWKPKFNWEEVAKKEWEIIGNEGSK